MDFQWNVTALTFPCGIEFETRIAPALGVSGGRYVFPSLYGIEPNLHYQA